MVGQSVHNALESLRAERSRIDSAIASLEGLISGGGSGASGKAGKVVARPTAGGGKKRQNAPRGMLKKYMHEALKKAGKAMAPIDLTNAVLKAGYPNRNSKSLYTAIFAAANKDAALKKTPAGWALK